MNPKPDFVLRTFIRCTRDALWEALRDPARLPDYYHMIDRAEREGDGLRMLDADGMPLLVCTDEEVVPKTRIAATFEPQYAPDLPASRFVWTIAPEGDHCALTLEHYDIPAADSHVGPTWERIVASLKTLLETGEAVRFVEVAQ
ncbi:MAG: SRPBCC domain-containing protein [Jannaschia sp.]